MRNRRNGFVSFLKTSALALVLLLGTATVMSAAGFQCQSCGASPQQARQEGITELMGDLVTNCTGGNPYGLNVAVGTLDIKVVINTDITSRLLDADVNGSEALLIVDAPAPGKQNICLAKDAPCPMLYLRGSKSASSVHSSHVERGERIHAASFDRACKPLRTMLTESRSLSSGSPRASSWSITARYTRRCKGCCSANGLPRSGRCRPTDGAPSITG